MDSVTQIALGAAVGESVLGRRIGNRAMLWGAIAGTLPDLDVFVPLGDAVRDFTYHRSASHSLLVLLLATPLLVWLINRVHPSLRGYGARWAVMIYLVFATHVLLDSFTVYGTQIFWPIVTTPVAWATIFIIDPLYTLPLLIGVIAALLMTRTSDRGHLFNRYGLIASTIYLSWTVAAKLMVNHRFESEIEAQDIRYDKILTLPAPFNSLLWRAVIMDAGGYYEAYYSLLDGNGKIRFSHYPSDESLLAGIEDSWPVQRLQWFSRGIYSVSLRQQDIVISDLRMGVEPHYAFNFKVAELENPHARAVAPELLPSIRDFSGLPVLWRRIWDDSVALDPDEHSGKP
ncbi:MAG: metal-dependent hydrolase [Gammaproteobacteria bacterium]|nr:metal-dependent hydrolase [Gammaproteobacteria bacterium]